MPNKDNKSFWAQPGKAEQMEKDHSPAADYLLSQLQIKPEASVLEVCCGNGWLLRKIAPNISHGLGFDSSPELIAKAINKSAGIGNLEFRIDKHANLPSYAAESFDTILGIEAVYWSPVKENLNQFYRILKPSGLLGLTVEAYKGNPDSKQWQKEVGQEIHRHYIKEYREMLQKAGFRDISITRYRTPRELAREDFQHKYGAIVITARK